MSTPIQSGASVTPGIHHASRFPVERTDCGAMETPQPASSDWAFVTCRRCLVEGAKTDPEARAWLERRDAERAAQRAETV